MKNENIKISSFIFIAFSLSAFVVVTFLFIFLSAKIHYTHADKMEYKIENISINEDYNNNTPYLTKAGTLKQIIDGPIISNFDPYLGRLEAPIKIIVYSDFTCHYCVEQEQIIKNLLKKYDGKVRFIWKDYPELDINSLSFKASQAARCAQEQNKFWDFHDALYANGTILNEDLIYKIADNLDLGNSFKNCFDKKLSIPLIMSNIKEANAIGIIGVPSVYINDKEFVGRISEEDFSLIIDSELKNE